VPRTFVFRWMPSTLLTLVVLNVQVSTCGLVVFGEGGDAGAGALDESEDWSFLGEFGAPVSDGSGHLIRLLRTCMPNVLDGFLLAIAIRDFTGTCVTLALESLPKASNSS